jgi:pimeloyl-ACP methyl ester carboxylesterase
MTDLAQAGVVPAGPFDMMGMHTGSVTTTQMSVAYPDRVRRAIMLGLAAYDDETRKAKLLSLGTYPMPKNDLSHIEAMWQNLQDLFDPRSTIEYRHKSMSENLRSVPRMPWGYEAVYRYDFRKALTEVTQPVMVLCPDDDLSEVTSQTAGLLPHGRMVRIPEAKHGLLVLETDRMAGLIRGFLDAETVA